MDFIGKKMLEAILLIIAGILAVPSLCQSKNRDAKSVINKVSPYQGWIGVIIAIWGIWSLISVIRYSEVLFNHGYTSLWILSIAIVVVAIILGFILGFNLIDRYLLSKSPASGVKGKKLIDKLRPFQKFFGILAIILGVIAFVYIFIFPF